MKRYFLLGLIAALSAEASFGAVVHQGSASVRIEKLLAEKQAKLKKLESCKGTTKNLKIAGLSTLGITAAGVVVNVAEAVELNKKEKDLTEAQKNYDTALEKNKKIVNAQQEEDNFKTWCGNKNTYLASTKTCTIRQTMDDITEGNASDKIQGIIVDGANCDDIQVKDNNVYTTRCFKGEFKIDVTVKGKAADAQPVQQKAEGAKAEVITSEDGVVAKEESAEVKNEVAIAPAAAAGDADAKFKTACEKLKGQGYEFGPSRDGTEQYCLVKLSAQSATGDANRKVKLKELVQKLDGVACDGEDKIAKDSNYDNQWVLKCNGTQKINRFYVRFGELTPRAQTAGNREGLDEDFAKKCRELGGGVPSLERDGDTLYYLCKKTNSTASVEQAGPLFQKFYLDFGFCSDGDDATIDKNGLVTKECLPSDGSVYGHYVGMKFSAQAACLPGIASQSLEIDEEKADIAAGFSLKCSCPEGQVYNGTNTACVCKDSKAFMPGKRECVDQPDNKHYIKDGYWTKCGDNQIASSGKTTCYCDTGFGFKDNTFKQCVQCGKGNDCYVNSVDEVATFCKLEGQGKVLNSAGTDCECPSGKGEDSEGNCIDCNETTNNGYIDANNKCNICAKGTKPNQNTKTCDTVSGT